MTESQFFFRFGRSCRSASLTRRCEFAGAAGAFGRPDRGRGAIRLRRQSGVSRLRRPIFRSFELRLDLNRRKTARLVRPPADKSKTYSGATHARRLDIPIPIEQRRSDKAGCLATVEVGPWPKLSRNGRRRRRLRFCFAAKGCSESYRASQRPRQRRRLAAFETAPTIGTNDITDKNLDLRTLLYPSRPIASCTRLHGRRVVLNRSPLFSSF
jgi:hypothetical protein